LSASDRFAGIESGRAQRARSPPDCRYTVRALIGPHMMRFVLHNLLLLAVTAGLWLFHIYARTLPTAALAFLWSMLTLLIASGLLRRARIRRRAFLSAWIAPASPLQHWLRGGWLLWLRQLPLAVLLALILLVSLVRLQGPETWYILLGAIPVLVLAEALAGRILSAHASGIYLPELCRRLALPATGAIVCVLLVSLAFHRPYPDLAEVSLERAVWHFVDREHARSDAALLLMQMAAAKDALRLWLAQQLMPDPGISLAQMIGWLLLFAEEALFCWSYLLVLTAVLPGVSAHDRSAH
jgi:hypothetical protein